MGRGRGGCLTPAPRSGLAAVVILEKSFKNKKNTTFTGFDHSRSGYILQEIARGCGRSTLAEWLRRQPATFEAVARSLGFGALRLQSGLCWKLMCFARESSNLSGTVISFCPLADIMAELGAAHATSSLGSNVFFPSG